MALVFVGGCLIKEIKNFYSLSTSFSLTCAISSFVAGTGLRWRLCRNFNCNFPNTTFDGVAGDQNQMIEILKAFEYIWKFLQPLFFGFIGTAFQFQYIDIQLLFVILAILLIVLNVSVVLYSNRILKLNSKKIKITYLNEIIFIYFRFIF